MLDIVLYQWLIILLQAFERGYYFREVQRIFTDPLGEF